MGVREEDEREGGMPVGVRGVRGAEEGREGLDVVSSVELKESLLKGVYLVLGTSSMMTVHRLSVLIFCLSLPTSLYHNQ